MLDAENWSKVAVIRTARPTLDLDLSSFTVSLSFLINTYCITKEIGIIKLKTNNSDRGIIYVLPNDLSIT
jgi:hypothetical protein